MALRTLKLAKDKRTPKDYLQTNIVNIVNAILYNGYPKGKNYILYEDSLSKIKSIYQAIDQSERWIILKKLFKANKDLLAHHKISVDETDTIYLGKRPICIEPNFGFKEYLEICQ